MANKAMVVRALKRYSSLPFTLYALIHCLIYLRVQRRTSKAMHGHILEQATLIGTYNEKLKFICNLFPISNTTY
jgi:hypothetical protein